eukprot:7579062-Lingulodinium_polyedra.AAC.1
MAPSDADYFETVAHLVDLGILAVIDERDIFRAHGKRVTNGIFAVEKSGVPAPGEARVTRFILNMVPANSYLRVAMGD